METLGIIEVIEEIIDQIELLDDLGNSGELLTLVEVI